MKRYIIFFFLFLPVFCFSQNDIVHFLNTNYNWGDMISTQFPATTFKFVNLSNKPLAILNTQADYEIKISYPHMFVAPGDTGILYVKYESQNAGLFSKSIEINFNLTTEPVILHVSGNNVSAISCFPDAKDWTKRKVCIIDSATKEPVKEANCSFFCYTNGKTNQFKTDKEGKCIAILPIGMYDISLKAQGYNTAELSQNIPKTAPVLFFEMAKNKIVKPVAIPVVKTETNPVPLPIVSKPQFVTPKPITDIELPKDLYRSNNIVFLIDISKSMQSNHRLEKLKKCMDVLINALRDNDLVTIVVYNTHPKVLVESVNGQLHDILTTTIDTLLPTGFTNGVSGLEMAYSFAKKYFVKDGNNQLILATDGEFSGTTMSEQQMMTMVTDNANRGVILSIVGFAETKEIIATLQNMATLGHGSFILINEQLDQRLLIEEIKSKSALNTVTIPN
jgi:uncharacterized protein YegL